MVSINEGILPNGQTIKYLRRSNVNYDTWWKYELIKSLMKKKYYLLK